MRKTRLRKTRRKTQNQLSPLTPRRPMTAKAIILSKADGINPGKVLFESDYLNLQSFESDVTCSTSRTQKKCKWYLIDTTHVQCLGCSLGWPFSCVKIVIYLTQSPSNKETIFDFLFLHVITINIVNLSSNTPSKLIFLHWLWPRHLIYSLHYHR